MLKEAVRKSAFLVQSVICRPHPPGKRENNKLIAEKSGYLNIENQIKKYRQTSKQNYLKIILPDNRHNHDTLLSENMLISTLPIKLIEAPLQGEV